MTCKDSHFLILINYYAIASLKTKGYSIEKKFILIKKKKKKKVKMT